MLYTSNQSHPTPTSDYDDYIIALIKDYSDLHGKSIAIGDAQAPDGTLRIAVNYEHTIVKEGAENSDGCHMSPVYPYLVRIVDVWELNRSDIVIDYSATNVHHVASSGLFPDIAKKHVYIAPTLYPLYTNPANRDIPTLTTFINTHLPRRKKLLDALSDHVNVSDCFDRNAIRDVYMRTRVLINIHQTDYHCTLEELRVLPALQCGVIVVCESSPLLDVVSYADHIVWAQLEAIPSTVRHVLDNYDEYHKKIFGCDFISSIAYGNRLRLHAALDEHP